MRRAWSVSVYCRHEKAILLVLHKGLGVWVPVGGEILNNERPIEAAQRKVHEETGFSDFVFPVVHKLHGAPPGLLLYEEYEAGDKGLHMNLAFVVDVLDKGVRSNGSYTGMLWVSSMTKLPDPVPQNVLDALPYAFIAGVK
jgi:8-oxo-dGTP diphosphatase